MQQNQTRCTFYSTHSCSLSKPGTYIIHDPTGPPTVQFSCVMLAAANVSCSAPTDSSDITYYTTFLMYAV